MKNMFLIVLSLFSISSFALENLALRVRVMGKEMSPDPDFTEKVLQVVAHSFGTVEKIHVEARGEEGGQTLCLETSPLRKDVFERYTVKKFEALKTQVPADTEYSLEPLSRCP